MQAVKQSCLAREYAKILEFAKSKADEANDNIADILEKSFKVNKIVEEGDPA